MQVKCIKVSEVIFLYQQALREIQGKTYCRYNECTLCARFQLMIFNSVILEPKLIFLLSLRIQNNIYLL